MRLTVTQSSSNKASHKICHFLNHRKESCYRRWTHSFSSEVLQTVLFGSVRGHIPQDPRSIHRQRSGLLKQSFLIYCQLVNGRSFFHSIFCQLFWHNRLYSHLFDFLHTNRPLSDQSHGISFHDPSLPKFISTQSS